MSKAYAKTYAKYSFVHSAQLVEPIWDSGLYVKGSSKLSLMFSLICIDLVLFTFKSRSY